MIAPRGKGATLTIMVVFAESGTEQGKNKRPLPTLGEIIDKLAKENPEIALGFDSAWRDRHVAKVQIVTQ